MQEKDNNNVVRGDFGKTKEEKIDERATGNRGLLHRERISIQSVFFKGYEIIVEFVILCPIRIKEVYKDGVDDAGKKIPLEKMNNWANFVTRKGSYVFQRAFAPAVDDLTYSVKGEIEKLLSIALNIKVDPNLIMAEQLNIKENLNKPIESKSIESKPEVLD